MATSPDIHQELQALFDWNPPLLHIAQGGSPSRPPAFFDKHLAPELILKHVRHLPSLVKDITGTVDTALKSIEDNNIKLPPLTGMFCSALDREEYLASLPKGMENELSVMEFYLRTTALFCAPVASVLALYPQFTRWTSILVWTQTPTRSSYAIADGSLKFSDLDMAPGSTSRKLLDAMDETTRMLVPRLKDKFPHLINWEMKNLSVGYDEVMQAILGFKAVPFPWVRCNGKDCRPKKHTVMSSLVGPDAIYTPWKLPRHSQTSNTPAASGSSKNAVAAEYEDVIDDPLPSPSKGAKTRTAGRKIGGFFGSVRNRVVLPIVESRQKPNQDKYRKPKLTAQNYIQRAWAESVRHDTTLIILNAGNFEYVGVRHRKTQTLYLSDLIYVDKCVDPGYGKLHIGIYIAGLQDAMDRVRQIPEASVDPAGDDTNTDVGGGENGGDNHGGGGGSWKPNGWGRDRKGKGRDRDGDDGSSKRQKTTSGGMSRGQGKSQRMSETCGGGADKQWDETPKWKIEEFNKRNWLLMSLQYSIYDSPIPASFVRAAPPIPLVSAAPSPPPSPHSKQVLQPDDYMTLVLTSEIGTGAIGVTLGGTLEVETSNQCITLDVVVKLAFSNEQQESLEQEYDVYRILTSKGIKGIPTPLGLFNDNEDGPSALVMTHAGVSVSGEMQTISVAARLAFQSTLKEIHKAGVLHGDLRRENLLVDRLGRIAIIDFDQSKKTSSAEAMEWEIEELANLLG